MDEKEKYLQLESQYSTNVPIYLAVARICRKYEILVIPHKGGGAFIYGFHSKFIYKAYDLLATFEHPFHVNTRQLCLYNPNDFEGHAIVYSKSESKVYVTCHDNKPTCLDDYNPFVNSSINQLVKHVNELGVHSMIRVWGENYLMQVCQTLKF